MADALSKEQRSRHMGRIRQSGTGPEMAVRRLAHRLGFRFRIGRKDLPGRPDIVFPGRRALIFVHGCFWHRHSGCRRASTPGTNVEFWKSKFEANVRRDEEVIRKLHELGWRSLVIWECETSDEACLSRTIKSFLEGEG